MEILLIIRFCCNCTYGNPGPLSREVGVPPTSGGRLEGAEAGGGGIVAGEVRSRGRGSRAGMGNKWLDLC